MRYSRANENCLDLVLFLNGVPTATVELKTDFTQSVQDAVDQYKYSRLPRPKTGAVEPLLAFPSGALVHFAVSNTDLMMTTRLEGPATTFLPFNQGDHGAKGNPIPPFGHPHGLPVGNRSGRATAGWKSSVATWWRSGTKSARSRG